MLLPSKLYSYSESTLALIPYVMQILKGTNAPIQPTQLYRQCSSELSDASDFLDVMDCLFLLGAVDINEKGELFKCF